MNFSRLKYIHRLSCLWIVSQYYQLQSQTSRKLQMHQKILPTQQGKLISHQRNGRHHPFPLRSVKSICVTSWFLNLIPKYRQLKQAIFCVQGETHQQKSVLAVCKCIWLQTSRQFWTVHQKWICKLVGSFGRCNISLTSTVKHRPKLPTSTE